MPRRLKSAGSPNGVLAEQPQHRLVGLRRERQRGGGKLLAGLQGQHVGAFLVGVGQHQIVGAGLQRADQVLGEVLTGLHGGELRAEGRGLGAQRLQCGVDGAERRVDVANRSGSRRRSRWSGRARRSRR